MGGAARVHLEPQVGTCHRCGRGDTTRAGTYIPSRRSGGCGPGHKDRV